MLVTIDKTKYSALLAKTLPGIIETEEENECALETVNRLMDKGEDNLSPEENRLFRLFVRLIEDFEEKAYPMPDVKPHERLKYLLEEKEMKQKDLLPIFNSEGVVSDILNGKRPITLKTARKLADFLNVSVELFV
ncbi:MAG: helix-turn-helix domain-containing protein [Pyrinomonadaceae bacterium]